MIVINGRFLTQRITGVQRYAREIVAELDKLVKPGEMLMAVPPGTADIPTYRNIEVVQPGRLGNRLWEQLSFPLYVRKRKGTSLNLCNVSPLLSPGIVCMMDMKIRAVPQFFDRKFVLWYRLLFYNAARRAKQIITISEFSKKEICRYYHTDPDRIEVIPCAWQHFDRTGFDEGALKKYGLEKDKYYFSMCSLEPNKNFRWIAEAAKNDPEQLYAVAGSVDKNVFKEGMGFDCPDNMKLLGYITDEEAKTLMRDCRAFLFPTIYEGFGMPPLEALSAGCSSIVVSDTEVMHEVFEGLPVYVDPTVYKFETKSCKETKSTATDILKKYSWEQSAWKLKNLKVLANRE